MTYVRAGFPCLCIVACAVGAVITWTGPVPTPASQPWVNSPLAGLRPHVEGATAVILVTDDDATRTHLVMKYVLAPMPVVWVRSFEEAATLALDGACIAARFSDPTILASSLRDALGRARAAGVEVAVSRAGEWTLLRAKNP